MEELPESIERSDPAGATAAFDRVLGSGVDPWSVHLALFPIAQRVLNPPFINPHLPKMHAICREFLPFLESEDLASLVHVEIGEFARRPLLEPLPTPEIVPRAPFSAVQVAVERHDRHAAAVAMAGFAAAEGHRELAGRIALLGSGYLDGTLGHSISCSVFLLQEMIERGGDPWPAFAVLADYCVKGRFARVPTLDPARCPESEEALQSEMLRAVTGTGVVDLHHTITLYAADRARPWCSDAEAQHVLGAAVAFLGDKQSTRVSFPTVAAPPADYDEFQQAFSRADAATLVGAAAPLLASASTRRTLGRFLIKAVCQAYQGDYDPHFLTGLGSLLWVLERFPTQQDIQEGAVFQYAAYFFRGLKRQR